MIAIVDYGMGNVGAIRNMLRKIGAEAVITANQGELRRAGKLILPGIGAFDQGMQKLEARGLAPILTELVLERRVPILGICLGLQLFGRGSEEGSRPGLGWLDAECVRFRFPEGQRLKVPHMRWNCVAITRGCPLLDGTAEEQWFYFVHSYHMVCHDPADVVGVTPYGYEFASAAQRGNVYGVQFHPEKSLRHGMRLLARYAELPDGA